MTERVPRRWQRTFCPHCEEAVSKSTYYRHREKFYDVRTGEWRKSAPDVACGCSGDLSDEQTSGDEEMDCTHQGGNLQYL